MTTKELLGIVKDRGLDIRLKDGRPLLVRPSDAAPITDALLAVLKIHRERIIERLNHENTR